MSQRCRMHVRWGGELPRSQPFGGTRTPSQQGEPVGENAYGFAALLQAMQMLPRILPGGEDAAPGATASALPTAVPNGDAGFGFPHQTARAFHKPECGLGQALMDNPLGAAQPAVPQASGPETSQANPAAEVLLPEGGQGEAQARFGEFAPPNGADGLQGVHAGAFSAVITASAAVGSEQGSPPTLQGVTGQHALEMQLRTLFLQELMRSAAAGRSEHPPAVAHMRVELPQWGTLALSVAVAEDSVRVQAETESSELGRTLGSNTAELERMLAGRQLRLELLEVRVRSSEMGFSGGSLPQGNPDAQEYRERHRFVSSFRWHRNAAAATSQDVTPSTGAVHAKG
jgi:hypothetical protein